MHCSNCGKKNPTNSKFCQHCGIKMTDNRQVHAIKEGTRGSKLHLIWKIPLGFIGFCILAFILLYAFSSSFRTGFNNGYNGNTTNNTTNVNSSNNVVPTTDVSSWISYTSDSNQFTVMLPSYPLHKVQKDNYGNNYDSYTTSTDNENTGYFIDVYSINPPTDTDTFLETTLNKMLQGVGNNAQVTYRDYINFGSDRALNYAINYSNETLAGRIILDSASSTMYVLLDGYYDSTPDTNGLKEFLSSFQINTQ